MRGTCEKLVMEIGLWIKTKADKRLVCSFRMESFMITIGMNMSSSTVLESDSTVDGYPMCRGDDITLARSSE